MGAPRTSPNFRYSVDHHSEEGKAKIANLRQAVKDVNKGKSLKIRVRLQGRGFKDEAARQEQLTGRSKKSFWLGGHRYQYIPLHRAKYVDVYVGAYC